MALINLKHLVEIYVYNKTQANHITIKPERKSFWRHTPKRIKVSYLTYSEKEFFEEYKERYVIENDIVYEQCEVKLQFTNWRKSFYFPTIEEAFKFREDIKSKELSASDYWFDTETFSISTNK